MTINILHLICIHHLDLGSLFPHAICLQLLRQWGQDQLVRVAREPIVQRVHQAQDDEDQTFKNYLKYFKLIFLTYR